MIIRNLLRQYNRTQNLLLKSNAFSFHTSFPNYGPKKDPYSILGVTKSATQADIKKAYYALAQKYHPDKNPAADAKNKFAEISGAYETLGDEQKRKTYDSIGMTSDEQDQYGAGGAGGPFGGFWGGQGGPQGGMNMDETIFGDFESFFNMGMGGQAREHKGADILLNVEISFMDAVHGARREIVFEKKGECPTCKGTKCKPGSTASTCGTCGGKGATNFRQGPMTIQMNCSKCKGTGKIIKNPCTTCRGVGSATIQQREEVNIPKGISNGQNLRMQGRGNLGSEKAPAGDLIIRVTVKPDPYFKREGADIYTDAFITISQAVLGGTTEVKTLNGTQNLRFDRGVQHGQKLKLAGQGIPKLNTNEKGDHYVNLKIVVPKNLNQKQQEIFKQLSMVEEKPDVAYYSKHFKDESQQQQQQSKQQQYEEEGEERGGGRRKQSSMDDQEDMFNIFSQMFNMGKGRR
jgi:molecular chaperone DnaJ